MKVDLFDLMDELESFRLDASQALAQETRGKLGQFMTPVPTAELMAAMFKDLSGDISILDAGAGVGSLTAAVLKEGVVRGGLGEINATLFEIDRTLEPYLQSSTATMKEYALRCGRKFNAKVNFLDFIECYSNASDSERATFSFDKIILNPPYLKIGAKSEHRLMLRRAGIEAGNLYSAFVSIGIKCLKPGGELVAITPRSFCNGPYFNDFRKLILETCSIDKIHVFESRTKSFKGDSVLQENIIFRLTKGEQTKIVDISASTSASDSDFRARRVPFSAVVDERSSQKFIHIVTSDEEEEIANAANSMPCELSDLNLSVSTGRIVDFRNREALRTECADGCIPFIYPSHIVNGVINWPSSKGKGINGFKESLASESMLLPMGSYVVTKRLSSKEEKRRIIAGVITPDHFNGFPSLGLDNKTNFFHCSGGPVPIEIAYGLSIYLNSTIVDRFFRQFNGHTQVNATDLRSLKYPTRDQLVELGKNYSVIVSTQRLIDDRVAEKLFQQM
ncbi:MAG: Eco57I restriction-modification methylase domain-containing protein [Oceanospirillaceae bacterium]|nr:Eco57I restriction-modification methylase domain-containing protein [Oceanospirillaceae bacterium]